MLPFSIWPLVVETILEQRAAEPLHDAAAHLLIHKLRIDHRAAIFHAPMLQELDEAGIGIDFQIGRLDAVGEGEGPAARHIMARRHHLGLEAGRQRIGPEIADARNFGERDALARRAFVDHDAFIYVERLGLRLQDRGRRFQHILAQRLARLPRRFAADAGRARGPGPPP